MHIKTGLPLCVCVCVFVSKFNGYLRITCTLCSCKKQFFSDLFFPLPIIFSDEIILSFLLLFLYRNRYLNYRCKNKRINRAESSYALFHPPLPQILLSLGKK
jgi:hypothetical protein